MEIPLTQIQTAQAESAIGGPTLYARLRRIIRDEGLLERRLGFYALWIPVTVALLLPGVACFIWLKDPWIQVLNAVWMAFAYTQVIFLGHDAGHRQVFRKTWKNDLVGYLGMPVTGLSLFWWMHTHNQHHAHPNQTGKDPAIDFSFLAFSEGQALAKRGINRWLVKYQALYFIPVCLLYPVSMRIQTAQFYLKGGGRRPALEISLLVLHHVLYLGGIFALLPVGSALIFIAVHQGLFSLFMVSTFAPNHKGLEILEEDERWDFLEQQVVTAQNVKGGYLTDLWYGGLNFQIEHHLFPTMPRWSLRRAAPIVREFCQKESIPYRETWPIPFYWNLIRYMYRVAAPLRGSP